MEIHQPNEHDYVIVPDVGTRGDPSRLSWACHCGAIKNVDHYYTGKEKID